MEWVEVSGKTVEVAVQAAIVELGVRSADDVVVEVLQEPKSGFLGIGGQDAVVKVTPKPRQKSGRRRRRRGRGRGDGGDQRSNAKSDRSGGGQAGQQGKRGGGQKPGGRRQSSGQKSGSTAKRGGDGAAKKEADAGRGSGTKAKREATINERRTSEKPEADINEQAAVAKEFLVGLLEAFGLEGAVATRIDDDILYVDVTGGQTEALVGTKGAVMQAVHELTRTVIQRKTFGAPRMRIDIAGYTERRREALRIYTAKLADKVLDEGGEIMLEPMNAADRKVVHDAVVDIAGVRSFSEGVDPQRAVVIALEDGVAPRGEGSTEPADRPDEAAEPDDDGGGGEEE